jgi:hypothetical protein
MALEGEEFKINRSPLTDKVNASPEIADLPLRLDVEQMGAMTPVLATPGAIYTVPVVEVTSVEVVTIAGPHRSPSTRQER